MNKESSSPAGTRWVEDASLPAPDGHVWARPVPDDCPNCPCHTARVCQGFDWHRAERPTLPDGEPYTDPCPCEQAAPAPEQRQVTLTIDDETRTVAALFHHHGLMRGRLQTVGFPFCGQTTDGALVARCGMVLSPATDTTPVEMRALDDQGQAWVLSFQASVAARPARITGWWDRN